MPCRSRWSVTPLARPGRQGPAVLALAAALAPAALAACTSAGPDGPVPTAPAPASGGPAGLLAERHTWGGMCPEGPCVSTLTVRADGRWTWSDEAGSGEGRLSSSDLERVWSAVSTTQLGSATADDGVTCEADHDGRSVRLGWADPAGWRQVSSCEVRIKGADPLVVVLEALADESAARGRSAQE